MPAPKPFVNHYAVLGLDSDRTADLAKIKKAYRLESLKNHPDKRPDDVVQANIDFVRVKDAYDVLSDPRQREVFDLGLRAREQADEERQEWHRKRQEDVLRNRARKGQTKRKHGEGEDETSYTAEASQQYSERQQERQHDAFHWWGAADTAEEKRQKEAYWNERVRQERMREEEQTRAEEEKLRQERQRKAEVRREQERVRREAKRAEERRREAEEVERVIQSRNKEQEEERKGPERWQRYLKVKQLRERAAAQANAAARSTEKTEETKPKEASQPTGGFWNPTHILPRNCAHSRAFKQCLCRNCVSDINDALELHLDMLNQLLMKLYVITGKCKGTINNTFGVEKPEGWCEARRLRDNRLQGVWNDIDGALKRIRYAARAIFNFQKLYLPSGPTKPSFTSCPTAGAKNCCTGADMWSLSAQGEKDLRVVEGICRVAQRWIAGCEDLVDLTRSIHTIGKVPPDVKGAKMDDLKVNIDRKKSVWWPKFARLVQELMWCVEDKVEIVLDEDEEGNSSDTANSSWHFFYAKTQGVYVLTDTQPSTVSEPTGAAQPAEIHKETETSKPTRSESPRDFSGGNSTESTKKTKAPVIIVIDD